MTVVATAPELLAAIVAANADNEIRLAPATYDKLTVPVACQKGASFDPAII